MENKKEKTKDEEQLEELERLGKEIDQIRITQTLVNRNPNVFRKPQNILYRLPLSESQREAVFNNIIKEAEKGA